MKKQSKTNSRKEMVSMLMENHWVRHQYYDNWDLGWQELTEALLQRENLVELYLEFTTPTTAELRALLSMRPTYRKHFMACHLIMACVHKGQLEELAGELDNDNFRICDQCGLPHIHGYVIGGCEHYCNENCLAEGGFNETDMDGDENYFTEYGR